MARQGESDDPDLISPVSITEVTDGGDDDVLALGNRRPMPTWLIVVAIAVLGVGVVGGVALKAGGHHDDTPPPSVSVAPPEQTLGLGPALAGTPIDPAATAAVDLAVARGLLFVLNQSPARLDKLDARTGRLDRRAPAPSGSHTVVVDGSGRLVWVVADDVIRCYDAANLSGLDQVAFSRSVSASAALDGRLFAATDHGIYIVSPSGSPPSELPGYPARKVQDLVADPIWHRLFAVTTNYELLEVTVNGVHFVRRLSLPVLPTHLVATSNGIWAVGFGGPGGTRIARLDPVSLRLVPAAAGDADAPQGASGWPGESVFWVQKEYTTGMACHDAGSGDSVAFYDDVDGPVRSVRGVIYAVSHGAVYRLPATRACPG